MDKLDPLKQGAKKLKIWASDKIDTAKGGQEKTEYQLADIDKDGLLDDSMGKNLIQEEGANPQVNISQDSWQADEIKH